MPAIDGQEKLGPVAWDVAVIARSHVELAGGRAARTLGGDAHEVVQGEAVIGVLEDGGESLQETTGPVAHLAILNVVADGQPLLPDDLLFLGRSKRALPFLRRKRFHGFVPPARMALADPPAPGAGPARARVRLLVG